MDEWLDESLSRWVDAGVIDDVAAARIREYESSKLASAGLRTPVLIELAFGALALGAGILLFVSSHWDELSPGGRFSLILIFVAAFHAAGAFAEDKFPDMAITLHGLGTVTFGGGIYLSGQIFNLSEHWSGGILLWAIGAWIGWFLRRDWMQLLFLAILTPLWAVGKWLDLTQSVRITHDSYFAFVMAGGITLLATTYLSALQPTKTSHRRKLLAILGCVAIIPSAALAAAMAQSKLIATQSIAPSLGGMLLFYGVPLAIAWRLRGPDVWKNGVAALWIILLGLLGIEGKLLFVTEVWCAIGAIAMVAWGVNESRPERVNIGIAGFVVTLLFFYFSSIMDMLGRSLSLIVLGILLLSGGWALERMRRKLIAGISGSGR